MATVTEKEIREWADEWARLELKIAPIAAKRDAIAKRIKDWLKTSGRKVTITSENAIAKRDEVTKFGPRELPVERFLEATQEIDEAERAACLKVEIGKAVELLGTMTVDRLATRPTITKMVESLELKAAE